VLVFFFPQSVQIKTTNTTKRQLIAGGMVHWTPVQEVKENTLIALERGGQMVAIPTYLVMLHLLGSAPHESVLSLSHKTVEAMVWVGEVAGSTPG
jgi:hypothetical protein